jgi:VWFA-related protein
MVRSRLILFVNFLVCPAFFSSVFCQYGQAQQSSLAGAGAHPLTAAPLISVDARLVNLPVVVRDKKGALLRDLTKTDFSLQVDGHPQAIRYFDIDSNLPLILGLLVDTSLSQRSVIDEERTASAAFLDHMLTDTKDLAFVIQFARQVELLGDLTNSRSRLQAALKEIDTPSPNASASSDSDDSGGDSTGNRHGGKRTYAGGTTLYDATFLASDELMRKHQGRKAIIILSDGVDKGSKETLNKALESAQRADTIVYSIYFKGEERQRQDWGRHGGGRFPGGGGYPGGHGGGYPGGGYPGSGGGGSYDHVDGKKVLRQISEETGGRIFEVSKKQTISQIYDQIAEELRAQYRLGYTPDQMTSADGYHRIELAAHRKDLFVQTRDGYYADK